MKGSHCFLIVLRKNPANVGQEVHILLCDQLLDVCDAILCPLRVLKQRKCTLVSIENAIDSERDLKTNGPSLRWPRSW